MDFSKCNTELTSQTQPIVEFNVSHVTAIRQFGEGYLAQFEKINLSVINRE